MARTYLDSERFVCEDVSLSFKCYFVCFRCLFLYLSVEFLFFHCITLYSCMEYLEDEHVYFLYVASIRHSLTHV